MPETVDKFKIPPKVSKILLEITESSRPEEAFGIILKDYLDEKIKEKEKIIRRFEEKWGMNFRKFKEKSKENNLPKGKGSYSQEVEEDYREWGAAITLLKKYKKIREGEF